MTDDRSRGGQRNEAAGPARRRVGAEDSATRRKVLDATVRIMLEEGHAAATSRRVAAVAGIRSALVHYYFPTMDDLFLAVFRRGADVNLGRQRQAIVDEQPLRALWELSREPHGTRLMLEFMALANQRPAIRAEIATYTERFREIQTTALTFILRASGLDTDTCPPTIAAILIASLSGFLATESALGITAGHAELITFVDDWLRRFETAGPDGIAAAGSSDSTAAADASA